MSPVASSILAPSLRIIGEEFNIEIESVKSLCLSIFVLGFAFGPLVLAPLSEIFGRSKTLHGSNVLFFIFNTACGFSKTKEQLIIFRLLAGLGGSAPLALGPGTVADLFSPDERGLAGSIYSFFPILGPTLGPLCGGFIAEYSNWRWGFWATSIFDVPILLLGYKYLEETYAVVLLLWKKKNMVKETGNVELFTRYEKPGKNFCKRDDRGTSPTIEIDDNSNHRPCNGFRTSVSIWISLWREGYGQSVSIGGLNYISLGIGYCIGIQVSSYALDWVYRVLKRRNNGIGLSEFRAPMLFPVGVLLPTGFLLYGWSAEKHMQWIVPNIGAAIFACGIMIGFNAQMTYVVDAYQTYSASAAAATAVLRSVAAFLLPLGGPALYQNLGYGWGNSLLGFLGIIVGGPAPILLWYYGARLRAKSTFAAG